MACLEERPLGVTGKNGALYLRKRILSLKTAKNTSGTECKDSRQGKPHVQRQWKETIGIQRTTAVKQISTARAQSSNP